MVEVQDNTVSSPKPLPFAAWLIGIFILALALRLGVLHQIATLPYYDHPVGDAASYWNWAGRIVSGEGDREAFYQAPAYPYFLAILRACGVGLGGVRVVQSVLGALSCVLLTLAGRWFFRREAGIAAGLVGALYGPVVFYDMLIQKSSLGFFWIAMILALFGWFCREKNFRSSSLWGWLIIGVLFALSALTRENTLLFVFLVAPWVLLESRFGSVKRRVFSIGCVIVGMALVLVPVGIRNLHIEGTFAITTVQSGPNFYIGNSDTATGRYVPLVRGHASPPFERADATAFAQEAVGRELSPGEVSDFWWDQAFEFMREQPVRWVKLLGYKFLLTWNAYEIPDTEHYSLYQDWSMLLGGVLSHLHFGVLVPLAVAGIVLSWQLRRRLVLLYLLLFGITASVAIFYVAGRYRLPLVPVLLLFAGEGVVGLLMAWKQHKYSRLLLASIPAIMAALVVNLAINPEGRLNGLGYQNLATIYAQEGNLQQAIQLFELAREHAPDSGELRYNLGVAYAMEGQYTEAVDEYQAAVRLQPDLIHVYYNLGVALESLGRYQQALEAYQQAILENPEDRDAQDAIRRLQAP